MENPRSGERGYPKIDLRSGERGDVEIDPRSGERGYVKNVSLSAARGRSSSRLCLRRRVESLIASGNPLMVRPQATASLYVRLGGYDAISAVATELLSRLRNDSQLGRFWAHRGEDGIAREKQLLIDFLCQSTGGPLYYTGRDMTLSHKGMRISAGDWKIFLGHVNGTLDHFQVAAAERQEVVSFIESLRDEIVEC